MGDVRHLLTFNINWNGYKDKKEGLVFNFLFAGEKMLYLLAFVKLVFSLAKMIQNEFKLY